MGFLSKDRFRDLAVLVGEPNLKRQLHRARDAGLETLLDYQRLLMLVAATVRTRNVPGDVIEFGSYRGGSAGVLLQNIPRTKVLHICDSFEGMPEVSTEDNFHQKGDFSDTTAARVINGLGQLGDNFKPHIGFFKDTIGEMEQSGPQQISFAHIDADLYESVHDALEFCYPRMPKGAVIILDDYGAPSCLGAKMAADEFFESKPETVVALSSPAYGCIVGGGNAFEHLTSVCKFPVNNRALADRIFR